MSEYSEQEEHTGDLYQLSDVTVRIDGHAWCEIEDIQADTNSRVNNYIQRFQQQNPSGGSRIPVPVSRKVTFDADYDPTSGDLTGQIVGGAYRRACDTLGEDPHGQGNNNYWSYNTEMDDWEVGFDLCSALGTKYSVQGFVPTGYQIYNFDSVCRKVGAGIEEMGDFDQAWM